MYIATLRLKNFRNHQNSTFEFGEGTNVFLGDNGQGKTNVLEGLSYLCLTKSFYAHGDSVVTMTGSEMFEIEGKFINEIGNDHAVRIAYDKQESRKVVFLNKRPVEPLSTMIGKFPVVICSPEHTPITIGSPADRRKFVDFLISQSSAVYFERLMEYRHVLKQRNRILFEAKISGRRDSELLNPWSEQLIKHGAYIMFRRHLFVEEFVPYLKSAFHELIGSEEEPRFTYVPCTGSEELSSEQTVLDQLSQKVQQRLYEEQKFGTTLVGPHRDEFACAINDKDLRKYASQGQHKTFLVAMKIGEFFYLKERCSSTPMMLLDDIFSELDEHRSERLLHFVGTINQTFITSTVMSFFDGVIPFGERNRKFTIHQGAIAEQRLPVFS